MISSKSVTKIFVWIIRIWEIGHRRLHRIHEIFSIRSVQELTKSHSGKTNWQLRILIVPQWAIEEMCRVLEENVLEVSILNASTFN